jgi:PAS domain S-box-containing protein
MPTEKIMIAEDRQLAATCMKSSMEKLECSVAETVSTGKDAIKIGEQRRLAALLAAIPDIIMEVDINKIYTWSNGAGFKFFGDDVIGKETAYYFESEQNTYNGIDSFGGGGNDSVYVENWQRRRDGQKRLLAWRHKVLKDHRGEIIGTLSSARDITDSKLGELEHLKSLTRQVLVNQLQQDLLAADELAHKLKMITEGVVDIFEADFCRIWLTGPGDLCELGCMHAAIREGPNACRHKDKCLRLVASSGRYTRTNGATHQRIPFGAYKIGHIASGEEPLLITNDAARDPLISDHDWAKRLGLMSFAGFQLCSSSGESLGVLALFSTHEITPEERAQLEALSGVTAQVILRAQAEEALRQSEERFRLIAETIDEVFWMSDVVEEKMLYISPAFERIWGYSRQELYEDRRAFRKALHPEDFDRIVKALNVQKSGQPYDHEYRIIRPDGSVRQMWDRGFPVGDETGRVRLYVGVAQDVTAWKNAEKELRETKDYLNKIINCIADPVFVKDRQLRFVHVNDAMCAFSGQGRNQMLGMTVDQWLPREQADSIKEQEDSVFKSGEECIVEEEVNARQNEKRTVMTRKALLTTKYGEKQIVGVIRDITNMKLAEEQRQQLQSQLHQAQRLEAIGQLAAGIAHEINTPTQYVSDNTRFLRDAFSDLVKVMESYGRLLQECRGGHIDPALIADVDEAIATADLEYLSSEIPNAIRQSLEGLDRVATIVRAMKEFSHPGGEDKQTIDLNHAIENTVTVCRNEWKYVAEMALDLDSTLPLVPCLPGDFNQVILNLIVNAAHAIADAINGDETHKGTISISTRHDGGWAEIRIGDTGTGIPEKHRPKIFTPFFTTKEVGRGTGQGLAICRSVVVGKHGGTIDFETELGKGTVFIIRLPLHPDIARIKTNEKADLVC